MTSTAVAESGAHRGELASVRWSPGGAALIAVAIGIVLRVWSLGTTNSQIDGDQAVTGLMVEKMLHGTDGYVFVAGQSYNGAIEQYVQVLMFRVLPLPHTAFTLRLPEVAWSAVATWLVYLVGRRLIGERAAVVAALLFAVGPYWSVYKSIHSDGAYPSLIVIGLVAIWCSQRLVESTLPVRWALGIGVCAGLIAWNGLTGVELLIPAGFWCARIVLRSWRCVAAVVVGGVLGMAPLLGWSIEHHDFALLDASAGTADRTFVRRLGNVFGPLIREFTGVAGINGAPGWPKLLQTLAMLVLAVVFGTALVRRRHGIADLLRLREGRRAPIDALLLSVVVVGAVCVVSKYSWFIISPRYLYVFTPVLVWLVAAALPARLDPARFVASAGVVVIFAATSLTMLGTRADDYPGVSVPVLQQVANYLIAHGQTRVYADFWTAVPLQYISHSRVLAAPVTAGRTKFPGSNRLVWDSPTAVYVDVPHNAASDPSVNRRLIEAHFAAHHVTYTEIHLGQATIFEPAGSVKPWQVGLGPDPR